MPIRLDNPRELGADRLVNAVAGYDRCGDACVIVDFGTAITYDAVSSAGEYLGGIITPGIEISIEALTSRAARLPKVDIDRAALPDRQDDRRLDPVGDRVRVRRPRSTGSAAGCGPSSATGSRRSPPEGLQA